LFQPINGGMLRASHRQNIVSRIPMMPNHISPGKPDLISQLHDTSSKQLSLRIICRRPCRSYLQ